MWPSKRAPIVMQRSRLIGSSSFKSPIAVFAMVSSMAVTRNFGPKDEDCKPVSWILDEMVSHWGNNASWSIDKNNNPHEAGFLKLDCSKASNRLKWDPKWNLQLTLKSIVDWHQLYIDGGDIKKQCLKEINNYNK